MRLALTVVLLLVLAAPASAATVSVRVQRVQVDKGSFVTQHTVVVAASAGEANRIGARQDGDAWLVRDDGAPLQPGSGCASVGAEVRCDAPLGRLQADLGDGDDAIVVDGRSAPVDAGAGDDLVIGASARGGPGADVLRGTEQLDLIDGGAGPDVIDGLGGDDELGGDGLGIGPDPDPDADAAPDRIDGGAGRDLVSYRGRSASITVDLAAGTGGAAGEGDVLAGIEEVDSGTGPDVLRGDDGPNRLTAGSFAAGDAPDLVEGRGGDDALEGGAGDDVLDGGPGDDNVTDWAGDDRLSGGEGDDRLVDERGRNVLDGGSGDDVMELAILSAVTPRGPVRCGPGRDAVNVDSRRVVVAADCESVGAVLIAALRDSVRRPGRISWRVDPVFRARWFVGVTVRRRGGRLCGRAGVVVRRGRARPLSVVLRGRCRTAPLRIRLSRGRQRPEPLASWAIGPRY